MPLSVPAYEKDELYHDVLTSVKDKNCSQDVLQFLCFSKASFPYGSGPHMLGEILGYEAKKIRATLSDLRQVTAFPNYDDEPDEAPEDINRPLRIVHPDFEDFLIDKSRSGDFYINPQKAYDHLARTFLFHLPSVFSTVPDTSRPTRFLVSRLFVLTCTKITQPSSDLWKDLFELDLQAYLQLIRQASLSLCDSFDQLSRLVAWVKKKDDYATNILGFKRSLYMRFRYFWDIKVGSLIIQQCTEDIQASNVIAALQHPHFRDARPQEFVHMSRILDNARGSGKIYVSEWKITRDGVWLLGGRASLNGALLPMLSEYLNDPSRSGEMWNVQDSFSSMAKTIAMFLCTHAVPRQLKRKGLGRLSPLYHKVKELKMSVTTPQTFLYALRWLPVYLEKASYTNELAKYLKPDGLLAISQTLPEKIDFDQAITRYRASKSPSSEQVNVAEISIRSTRASTTDDCGYSYASSSTGLSTGDYGFYWIRRAFSQETVNTILLTTIGT